jgi:hypothetical protein
MFIFTILFNHRVYQVLVDNDNAINILFHKVMARMGISHTRLILIKTHLIKIEGSSVSMKGTLKLSVTISIPSKRVSPQQTFMVFDMTLAYNAILDRPLLH